MKYESLIKEAKELAIQSIKIFLAKLNINPDKLESIYNININVNVLAKDDAEYDHGKNIIILNKEYLDYMIDQISTDKEHQNRYVVDIARTITHEMLHANLYINGINNKSELNLSDKSPAETIMYQYGLEEALTSVITTIIIGTRNSYNLNIESLIERTRNNEAYPRYEKVGALLIDKLEIDMIKAFMTSRYNEYLSNEYGDSYNEIVNSIGKLYSLELIKERYVNEPIKEKENDNEQSIIQNNVENLINTYRKRL